MTTQPLQKLTAYLLKEHTSLYTLEHLFREAEFITLDHMLLSLIRKGKPCGVALCNEGLIIGDMFSSNPLQSALWYPTVPLTQQPDMTIDFFIRTFEIV